MSSPTVSSTAGRHTKPRRGRSRVAVAVSALAALALFTTACGGTDGADDAAGDEASTPQAPATTGAEADGDVTLVLYSGRGEDLVQPIIDRFVEETGIAVDVRYGDSSEMYLLIEEEGDNSPADVFYSQGAGFLGLLDAQGRLAELDAEILERLADPKLGSSAGDWVGLTGRARTVVYNTEVLSEEDLPDSFADFTDPQWKGRIGWAPTNASFQDHVTALRYLLGEDGARAWLEGIMANEPVTYEGNSAILEAVAAGEVDVGFTNHYYLYRNLAEDPTFPVANKYYTDGDPGALVNIAGAGVLVTSQHPVEAQRLIEFLLSAEAQEYFTSTNFELPLVADVEPAEGLPRIDTLVLPAFDLNQLLDLQGTVDLLISVGAL